MFRRLRRNKNNRELPSNPTMRTSRTNDKFKPPLAVKLDEHPESINSQLASPIFNKLPREVRDVIWRFSLTLYEDTTNIYDLGRRFARPGHSAPLRVAVNLLLTCREVYLEAFLVPFQVNPITVHDGDSRDFPPLYPLLCQPGALCQCEKLKPWQLAQIASVELNVQQFMLEGGSVERVARLVGAQAHHKGFQCRGFTLQGTADFIPPRSSEDNTAGPSDTQDQSAQRDLFLGRKITSLTIRMNRTDWWTWSSSPTGEVTPKERLRLEPMINTTASLSMAMTEGSKARQAGATFDFGLDNFEKDGRWGMQIGEYWPDITSLQLELETFSCKQSQLDYVLECAKLWTFPLQDGYSLVWDGLLESFLWRGATRYNYEGQISWLASESNARNGENTTVKQWSKSLNGQPGGQEFVIKTIRFEKRRDCDRRE